MSENTDTVNPDPAGASGPARSKHPRVTAVVFLVYAAILAALGVFWATAGDPGLIGPAVATIALAVACVVLAVLGFRIAAQPTGSTSGAGPVKVVTILLFAIGTAGAAVGIIGGGIESSIGVIASGFIVFALGLLVALQGALLYGTAQHRA